MHNSGDQRQLVSAIAGGVSGEKIEDLVILKAKNTPKSAT